MSNNKEEYDIPEIIGFDDLNEEIEYLVNYAYEYNNDPLTPEGLRSPLTINAIEDMKNQLHNEMKEIEKEIKEQEEHSEKWQDFAERERQKTELSVKKEKLEKIMRLQRALKNPEVKDLLFKVMKSQSTPQQAFAAINSNPDLKKQMTSLTLKGTGTRKGGKSRVFRRKNKKTTPKSRRNAQRTRRHRKSSTRRSTRK